MASIADPPFAARAPGRIALHRAGLLLVAASWASAALFGAYILAFYGGAVPRGTMGEWNETLPRLYEADSPLATLAIGAHFLTGGILLLLGPVQLIGAIRRRVPALHRWLGRAYVGAAALAGAGGLGFILSKGTVGGPVMSVGFGLYGALMLLAAAQALRHARARRFALHRAWGIRLFALAIGSWLYRMDYGFWLPLTGRLGHAADFSGPFDHVMAFFFYLPNLVVAELALRARGSGGMGAQVAATLAVAAATALVLFGSYFFATRFWGPAILAAFAGA